MGVKHLGPGQGPLSWRPQLGTTRGWDPLQAAPTPTPLPYCARY